jgi:hypothetical protein
MVAWQDFASEAPELAERVGEALRRQKHMTLATLRRDGSPRISGTEIEFSGADVFVGMMSHSRKALDLRRDPRLAIHGPTSDPPEDPSGWVGEAKLAGHAVEVPHDGSHRFRVDIDEVMFTHLNEAGDRLVIESWHPNRGREVHERK